MSNVLLVGTHWGDEGKERLLMFYPRMLKVV